MEEIEGFQKNAIFKFVNVYDIFEETRVFRSRFVKTVKSVISDVR